MPVVALPDDAPPLEVSELLSYPNPSPDGETDLVFKVTGGGMSIEAVSTEYLDESAKALVSIYTFSRRLVWRREVRGIKTGINVVHWDGKDAWGSRLANGTYMVRIELTSREKTVSKISHVIILR